MVKIKLGIDVHGVIDADPNFFAHLSYLLRAEGHEVHIITGLELCDELTNMLKQYNIYHTNLFSITSHHKSIGTYISYKNGDSTQPLIAPPIWNRTKADYAAKVGLNFHIDDSVLYGEYFNKLETQYLFYTPQLRSLLFKLTGWSNKFDRQLKSLLNTFIDVGTYVLNNHHD